MSLYERLNQGANGPSQQPANGGGQGPRNGARGNQAPQQRQQPADPRGGRNKMLGELRHRIHGSLIEELGPILHDKNLSQDQLRKRVHEALNTALAAERVPLSAAERSQVIQDVSDDVLGYGPIDQLLRDPDVSEIMCNGPDTVFVERGGKLGVENIRFADDLHLRRIIEKIVAQVGRRIDESSPLCDARLPDGSRVNAVVSPLAIGGPFLTIRKFSSTPIQVDDLIKWGTLSVASARFLQACIVGRLNVVVSGGTGSGKTTTLNVLSSFIPDSERIITVEDAKELQLNQRHVLSLETRPPNIEGKGEVTIRDLVKNTLRMRPDRIVIGECRAGEALDMLQAMNTGHDGSITTLHANSPRDSISRLETLVLMAGYDLPVRAIREQITSAVDVVVQLQRLRDGTRRITHITEVAGLEGETVTLQDIFTFDFAAGLNEQGKYRGDLKPTGVRPKFVDKLADYGIKLPPDLFSPPTGVGPAEGRRGRR